MGNPKIKFDHNYTKLHGQKTAVLREANNTSYMVLHQEAIIYDTEYIQGGEEFYSEIHNGQLVRLEFYGNKGIPFTKYIRAKKITESKWKGRIGDTFDLVVEEK